ncbi:hypothetical protein K449DRAFT_380045 [Hypoxylon sp. EC38]|nr:hypothetical protein K449DRAFT_380045 [Hypoxylon sp. EC38]
MKCTAITALGALFASAAVAQDITGSGHIYHRLPHVTGALTLSDCAIFTRLPDYPRSLSTAAGNCSFTDSSQVANTDSVYGAKSYAWHCRPDYVTTNSDSLYTVTVRRPPHFHSIPLLCATVRLRPCAYANCLSRDSSTRSCATTTPTASTTSRSSRPRTPPNRYGGSSGGVSSGQSRKDTLR